ncbi:hypothetical protein A3B32_02880 [Candidatus Uhrbacteria bacterium RIFCSPLOWO2_01_FULL_53_9]|uniref:Mannose-6-phosphate isomerase type II C-terminal domain-containing protein n=3 Tax=Candidatus Uhriibacteriota TaxID=1752732 RepID=A0A1F7UXA3_9BACT|nr:MAG: hypothetical protein A3C17_00990 [Candidatus Uhrbacteria bacterium RIFCSPHIGHO2_02_FULL_53_13]OGL82899.1 MAG: hypothetical protein A3B32_02880 [Candidatus Uhrbacteria bacterium RIFCSPLOWO2_01_FULL_53_9]OGL89886.1 MAG: hypothetical protein A3I45_03505 [Candidatus Uhrbacteria bacterium RIFCSPLOWO2_02_FULL_53_10]
MENTTVEKPWGSFTCFTHHIPSTVKLLNIKKGEAFSLQYHKHRSEFWKVMKGSPTVTIGEVQHRALEGDEFEIPPLTMHRIFASEEDVVVPEISTGDFNEDDIVSVEDKYGRA